MPDDADPFEDTPPYASDGPPFSVVLMFDPMMVAELAMGADSPQDIAFRYGLDEEELAHLMRQEWFERLVATKRVEFHDQGVLFTAKAGMMAEALLTRLFQQSMAGTIAAPLTVEVAKQLTDIGRLKPQPLNTTPGAAGGAFQINIQVNGSDVVHSGPTLLPTPHFDAAASTGNPLVAAPLASPRSGPSGAVVPPVPDTPGDKSAAPTLSLEFAPPKGKPPASISNLRTPDFDLRPNPGGGSAAAFGAGVPAPPLGLPTKPA